jgi:clan AA aspartic protease (TIGR02281 family)
MNVHRAFLLVGAIAAAASMQPEPAHAGGNGADVALGIIGGIIAGAAVANANRPPQPYYPQQPSYAGNSAACQSWLAVLNDPRYDATTRAQAQQIVSGCGLPTGGSDTRSTVASGYPGAGECAAWRATVADRQAYGIAARQDESEIAIRCGGGPAPAYAPAAAPTTGRTEIALTPTRGGGFLLSAMVNSVSVNFKLDTGADEVCLTNGIAAELIRRGSLQESDFRGVSSFYTATGSEGRSLDVVLREIRIGEHVAHNVNASTGCARPLLGQSFLRRFGVVTIDNRRNVLVLG